MNATELFLADGRSSGVYFCSQCRIVGKDKDYVDSCCVCRSCGLVIEDKKREYIGIHKACWNRERAERMAKRLQDAELAEDYDGPVFFDQGWGPDGYFHSIDDAIDTIENELELDDDWPGFAYCCTIKPFTKIHTGVVMSCVYDELPEELYNLLSGIDELERAFAAFNEANKGITTYCVDFARKVRIPMPEGWPNK